MFDILEVIARGDALPDVLAAICRACEERGGVPGLRAAILLYDPADGTLYPGAAPGLPPAFVAAFAVITAGRRETIVAEDIRTDPLWAVWRDATRRHGIRGCWSQPVLSATGELLATVAVCRDRPGRPSEEELRLVQRASHLVAIAMERHRAEARLRASEQRLAFALEGANDGLWDWDIRTGETYFSPRWETMLGYRPGEVPRHGNAWEHLVHPDDLPRVRRALAEHFAGRTPLYECEMRVRARDGSWVWLLSRGKVVERDAAGRPARAVGISTDFSARKQAEEERRRMAALLATVVDSAADPVFAKDTEGRYILVNAATLAAVGLTRGEMLGRTDVELFGEVRGAAFAVPDRIAMERGEPVAMVDVVQQPDGSQRIFHSVKTPLMVPDGRCAGVVGVARDITALKRQQAELDEAKREAERANRAKSTFLASVSHELRTPLNAVLGFSEALELGIAGPLNARQRDYVRDIRTSGQLLLDLVSDILDLARIEAGRMELHPGPTDLRGVVASCSGLLRGRAQKGQVRLRAEVPRGLPSLTADRLRLKQVLINLMTNAVKFTPAGGAVTVRAEAGPDEMEIVVEDTGIGMTAEEMELAQKPFRQAAPHRLDGRAEGAGLGLPIAKSLVELHGGRLELRSEKGRGTRVSIRLPLAPGLPSAAGPVLAIPA